MATPSVSVNEYKYLILTIFATFFSCWALREVFERIFGLSPRIRPTSALDKINKQMTRPLDLHNVYRITGRGSVWLVKGIWAACMFVPAMWCCLKDSGSLFVAHFIKMDPDSSNDLLMLHVIASTTAYYTWEVLVDRYGRIKWSALLHHICTVLAALLVLLGRYNPFATWFGITGIYGPFPLLSFFMAFRFIISNKYPATTRNLFTFTFYWYLLWCLANLAGQTFLIINAFHRDFDLYFLALMAVLLLIFAYDDYTYLKALRSYNSFEYESLDPLVDGNVTEAAKISVQIPGRQSDGKVEIAMASVASSSPYSSVSITDV